MTSVFGVKSASFNLLADWTRAREEDVKHKVQLRSGPRTSTKPPTGWIKINVDATCSQEMVGLGCVIRDEEGNFLRARCSTLSYTMNPKEAEAMSLREGLSWTKEWRNQVYI